MPPLLIRLSLGTATTTTVFASSASAIQNASMLLPVPQGIGRRSRTYYLEVLDGLGDYAILLPFGSWRERWRTSRF
jgi:hypothetical protein